MSSDTPCSPRLDSELERLFTPDGESIKSSLKIISSPSTDPTVLTHGDIRIESSKLILGLFPREIEAVQGYYVWRSISDTISHILRMARSQARGYRRRRAFGSGIREIERRYHERNKKSGP